MSDKCALVILAEGSEEMEAVIAVDVMRRGGIQVILAGVDGSAAIRCSRGVVVVPDAALAEVGARVDVLVLPGGAEGARRLSASEAVGERLRRQEQAGELTAAICAAPMALARHGVHAGRSMTSHPSVREIVGAHGKYVDAPVVEDGPLITSQGPGTAFHFGLALVRHLAGEGKAEEVRAPMMLP